LLASVPKLPKDGSERSERERRAEDVARFIDQYEVDPDRVAQALLERIDAMADERARFRRSLIYSVEMIEAADFDAGSIEIN
jgi:hypothetical protein